MIRLSYILENVISEHEIMKLFVYSKMTVIDELDGRERAKYFHLEFVEFLEYLCRVAHVCFHSKPEFNGQKSISLVLEKLLELLLKSIKLNFVSQEQIMLESQFLENSIGDSDED